VIRRRSEGRHRAYVSNIGASGDSLAEYPQPRRLFQIRTGPFIDEHFRRAEIEAAGVW
jgi:hypothetical protein